MDLGFLNLEDKDANEILDLFRSMDSFGDIRRFVIVLWGAEKSGKTHTALTSSELTTRNPRFKNGKLSSDLKEMITDGRIIVGEPCWIIDTEGKAKKLKHKFPKRDIRVLEVWMPDENHPLKCDVEKSLKNLMYALVAMSKQSCGTLVIDSWTDPNKWARKLTQKKKVEGKGDGWELGDLVPMTPTDYEARNDIIDFILYYIQNYIENMHIILCVRGLPKWETNAEGKRPAPGRIEKKCHKETMFFADVEIFLEKVQYDDGTAERVGKLVTTEYDDEDPISKEWINTSIPQVIDDIKYLAIKKRKMVETKKVSKKPAKKTKGSGRKRPVKRKV